MSIDATGSNNNDLSLMSTAYRISFIKYERSIRFRGSSFYVIIKRTKKKRNSFLYIYTISSSFDRLSVFVIHLAYVYVLRLVLHVTQSLLRMHIIQNCILCYFFFSSFLAFFIFVLFFLSTVIVAGAFTLYYITSFFFLLCHKRIKGESNIH
jgi:hypothetical protein